DLAFDPLVRNRPYPSFGSPTDYNAAGKIVIDTTSDLVDIQSAEMTGLVCGQPMTVKLVKRK
ncbi:MAG: hypothetical protein NTV34_11950, partial [Proteobacteria bacterium]|nr:hypothetical protein [Pseudomonadota bacterium]